MIGTLAWIIYRLGGEDHSERTNPLYTIAPSGLEKGFTRHLAAIHAYLRAQLTGRMPVGIGLVLDSYARSQPHNPLYQAIFHKYEDGDQTIATSLLMDEEHWPRNHCPTTENHCEKWVMQRDMGKDWEPCPEREESHLCADWLFSASIIIR
jgi:hypothetical protein